MSRNYRVELADAGYFRRSIKCQDACPVGTDAGGYVRAITRGDYAEAYLIARGPNPLASICGRVCAAPCEAACRRRELDQSVSIRALKRFAAMEYGVEAEGFDPIRLVREVIDGASSRQRRSEEDLEAVSRALGRRSLEAPEGDEVAIIGSGPAGLAAAHDLALLGYRPTIYEMEPVPAGMLAVGIPEYRLPRDLIGAEIEVIRSLGVRILCNTEVGKDIGFDELRAEYAATVIAIGAKRSRSIPIPGHDGVGVLGGVDILRDIALRESVPLGKRVVVIGGGNVAYDVSRSVIRQIGVDVSRTALRAADVSEVNLCCLESLEEMPADDIEILEGHEEGVRLWPSLGPKEIHLDDSGRVEAVSFKRVLSVFDESRRFNPQFDEEDITRIGADTVLWAIGQASDLSFLDAERNGIELTPRGLALVDPVTQQTTAPDVFVIGDAVTGLGIMIGAIASGKRAARAIHAYLSGKELDRKDLGRHTCLPRYEREKDYEKLVRLSVPATPVEERTRAQDIEVERGFDEPAALEEASRCLDCGVNTIFDSMKCVLCGGCVDVCPEDCLRIVSVGRLLADDATRSIIDGLCGGAEDASAIIKDEGRCIRCAKCADRCPSGAITMERFSFQGVWHERRA